MDCQALRHYQELFGCLVYLSNSTRLDISYTVFKLSRHMTRSWKIHLKAPKQVLRYLKGTMELGLRFTRGGEETLQRHVDEVRWRRRDWCSTTGYVMAILGAAVHWVSQVQKNRTVSTNETEYVATCGASQDVVSLRYLLLTMRVEQHQPTVMFKDNLGAIDSAKKMR